MLETIFMQVLDMTKTASIVIAVVIVARLFLKKVPKVISYALWAVVLFRLLCPVSIEAPVSLIPRISPLSDSYTLQDEPISVLDASKAEYQTIGDDLKEGEKIQQIDTTEQEKLDDTGYITSMWWKGWILFGQYVWLAGIIIMVGYSIVSYYKLKRKLVGTIALKDNIYLSDYIRSPFVIGVFCPKIYLPSSLSEKEQAYIILHEQHHIHRLDYIWKVLAFVVLCIHWFNPLVWIAFVLSGKDMEMSCDEAVIKRLGKEIRADYSSSLLNLATGHQMIAGTPLAFGEGNTKGRIKNLANWKEPVFWVVTVATVICIVLAVGMLTNPVSSYDALQLTRVEQAGRTHSVNFETNFGHQITGGKIVAEQWKDGECVKSAPVTMTQYAQEINLSMTVRYEEGYPTGVDIQMNTDQYGGFLLTYFAFPDDKDIRGWSFTSYEKGDKIKVTSNENRILAAMAFDDGGGVQVFDCETLMSDPKRLENAGYLIVIRADFYDTEFDLQKEEAVLATPTEMLQMNDVITLSQKGEELTWSDFEGYDYYETGSGLYIRVYKINSLFSLWIGGGDTKEKPMYISLRTNFEPEKQIDIRTEDVKEFIKEQDLLEVKLANLLDTICSSPVTSSSPNDYIQEHQEEYNELIGYGQFTLYYCFNQFLKGNQTDLRGHIMMAVCEKIGDDWGEDLLMDSTIFATGQDWFDEFRDNAKRLAEQDKEDFKKYYLVSWLLVQMINE